MPLDNICLLVIIISSEKKAMSNSPFQRNTRQRKLILEELQKLQSHPTAPALYEIVRRRLPKISLGTVYRNLELLAEAGTIRALESCSSEKRFDGNIAPHEHVRCIRCGRVDDLFDLPLDLSGGMANDCRGYRIVGYRLELLGICPACQAASRPTQTTSASQENPSPDGSAALPDNEKG